MEYLGRKSELKLALREVRDRETGMALNALRERTRERDRRARSGLERAELDRRLTEERVDVTMPGTPIRRGHLHLITQIRREVEDIFLGLGYTVVDGREVETTRYNFDALNFPPGHPTRSPLQTLFLDDETVLRTETSPSQIRTMEAQEPPVYIVSLGRVYRRDTPDATHTPTFHQVECLAVDEGITLSDLEGTLDYLLKALFGESRRSRFVTHHFPFTEPSVEALVSCHICDGSGCPVCRHSGWIEVGGSGMVDPNLFEFVGYDAGDVHGLRIRLGARAHRRASPRDPGSARALAQRPPPAGAVLMRAPLSWLREYVAVDASATEIAERLAIVGARGRALSRRRVADVDGNLGRFLVGRVLEVGAHPNADRLRVCQVDVGEGDARQIVCGAWNFEAGATGRGGAAGCVPPDPRPAARRAGASRQRRAG